MASVYLASSIDILLEIKTDRTDKSNRSQQKRYFMKNNCVLKQNKKFSEMTRFTFF